MAYIQPTAHTTSLMRSRNEKFLSHSLKQPRAKRDGEGIVLARDEEKVYQVAVPSRGDAEH